MDFIMSAVILIVLAVLIAKTFVVVRPTERGVKERFGKFATYVEPGLTVKIPLIEKVYRINTTERMVDAEKQEVITKDNLNATVDAQVYFRIKATEEGVKNAFYNVDSIERQMVSLARTTLRNVIGTMKFVEVNSQRNTINKDLFEIIVKETKNWGVEIVRTELKEIMPPADVQDTMNKVLKAENEKIAARDFAEARETEADGYRRAAIKQAEGEKQAKILLAQGDAESIRLVNESAQKYFKGSAITLRQLQTAETALKDNAKVIVPAGSKLINVVGEMGSSRVIVADDEEKPKKR